MHLVIHLEKAENRTRYLVGYFESQCDAILKHGFANKHAKTVNASLEFLPGSIH